MIDRDLRPANVLVTENDMVKVADFGTSRFLEIAAHGTTVIGSPPYMAPEQFHGKAVFASDIYSLGVTMYQMLNCRMARPCWRIWIGCGAEEMVSPPRLRNPETPIAVDDIVMRARIPADFGSLSAGRGLPAGHPAGAAETAARRPAAPCAGRRRRPRKFGPA